MNSNRKKVKCLSVLAEVQQYVLQNKRDPGEIVALLQPIISESPGSASENKIRQVVEKLKSEILQGKTRGKRIIDRHEILEFATSGPTFILESHIVNGDLDNMSDVLEVATSHGSFGGSLETRYINLTDDDLKFFFPYFEKARNEIENDFLEEALNY